MTPISQRAGTVHVEGHINFNQTNTETVTRASRAAGKSRTAMFAFCLCVGRAYAKQKKDIYIL